MSLSEDFICAECFSELCVGQDTFSFKTGLGTKQGRELLPFLTGEISLKLENLFVV